MALSKFALTDLATAKDWLGIQSSDTSKDARVTLLINSATQWIETYCDRRLAKRSGIVWYASGRRNNKLLTHEWPIIAIQSLYIDNSPLSNAGKFDATTLIPNTDYDIDDYGTTIVYQKGVFPVGYENIKVTYDAGYDSTIAPNAGNYEPTIGLGVPADLIQVCLWATEWYYMFRDRRDIGRKSKGKGDENTMMVDSIPQHLLDTLDNYRRTEFPALDVPVFNQ